MTYETHYHNYKFITRMSGYQQFVKRWQSFQMAETLDQSNCHRTGPPRNTTSSQTEWLYWPLEHQYTIGLKDPSKWTKAESLRKLLYLAQWYKGRARWRSLSILPRNQVKEIYSKWTYKNITYVYDIVRKKEICNILTRYCSKNLLNHK